MSTRPPFGRVFLFMLMLLRGLLIFAILCLAGCASRYAPSQRLSHALSLASEAQWETVRLRMPDFELMAFIPKNVKVAHELTVYLEGDGLAWLSPTLPSTNPTPINPISLRLALAHPIGQAFYLGRPCQYVGSNALGCDTRYWTEERFSPKVINAMSRAVDQLKSLSRAKEINLVGYSGGGAIAVLLAAQRSDVRRIVTVAGNLDTRQWSHWHGLGELIGSTNPADMALRVAHISQWHLVGGKDSNITPAMVQGYASKFPQSNQINVRVIDEFTHSCCWTEKWPELWQRYVN